MTHDTSLWAAIWQKRVTQQVILGFRNGPLWGYNILENGSVCKSHTHKSDTLTEISCNRPKLSRCVYIWLQINAKSSFRSFLCLITLTYALAKLCGMAKWSVNNKLKRKRKLLCLISRYYAVFTHRTYREPRNSSIQAVGVPSEIKTGHLVNTSHNHYWLNQFCW
jgi:hypothetical protein